MFTLGDFLILLNWIEELQGLEISLSTVPGKGIHLVVGDNAYPIKDIFPGLSWDELEWQNNRQHITTGIGAVAPMPVTVVRVQGGGNVSNIATIYLPRIFFYYAVSACTLHPVHLTQLVEALRKSHHLLYRRQMRILCFFQTIPRVY